MSHSVSLSCALAFSVIFSLFSLRFLYVYQSLSLTRLRARGLSLALQPQYSKERTPHPMAMNCDHYLHSVPFPVSLSCSFSRSFARSLSSSLSLSLSLLPASLCSLSAILHTLAKQTLHTRAALYQVLAPNTHPPFLLLSDSLPPSLSTSHRLSAKLQVQTQRQCKWIHMMMLHPLLLPLQALAQLR